jgi:hypothetical protein
MEELCTGTKNGVTECWSGREADPAWETFGKTAKGNRLRQAYGPAGQVLVPPEAVIPGQNAVRKVRRPA